MSSTKLRLLLPLAVLRTPASQVGPRVVVDPTCVPVPPLPVQYDVSVVVQVVTVSDTSAVTVTVLLPSVPERGVGMKPTHAVPAGADGPLLLAKLVAEAVVD
jgi:hypothetical protein